VPASVNDQATGSFSVSIPDPPQGAFDKDLWVDGYRTN
jgi:hypothetical protein